MAKFAAAACSGCGPTTAVATAAIGTAIAAAHAWPRPEPGAGSEADALGAAYSTLAVDFCQPDGRATAAALAAGFGAAVSPVEPAGASKDTGANDSDGSGDWCPRDDLPAADSDGSFPDPCDGDGDGDGPEDGNVDMWD